MQSVVQKKVTVVLCFSSVWFIYMHKGMSTVQDDDTFNLAFQLITTFKII